MFGLSQIQRKKSHAFPSLYRNVPEITSVEMNVCYTSIFLWELLAPGQLDTDPSDGIMSALMQEPALPDCTRDRLCPLGGAPVAA
jgi:hypothetical protein